MLLCTRFTSDSLRPCFQFFGAFTQKWSCCIMLVLFLKFWGIITLISTAATPFDISKKWNTSTFGKRKTDGDLRTQGITPTEFPGFWFCFTCPKLCAGEASKQANKKHPKDLKRDSRLRTSPKLHQRRPSWEPWPPASLHCMGIPQSLLLWWRQAKWGTGMLSSYQWRPHEKWGTPAPSNPGANSRCVVGWQPSTHPEVARRHSYPGYPHTSWGTCTPCTWQSWSAVPSPSEKLCYGSLK